MENFARLIVPIEDDYTKSIAKYIEKGVFKNMEIKDSNILVYISKSEYELMKKEGKWYSRQLGLEATLDKEYLNLH